MQSDHQCCWSAAVGATVSHKSILAGKKKLN